MAVDRTLKSVLIATPVTACINPLYNDCKAFVAVGSRLSVISTLVTMNPSDLLGPGVVSCQYTNDNESFRSVGSRSVISTLMTINPL